MLGTGSGDFTHSHAHTCAQISADADVAKRVFYLAEGRMRVDHHYGESRVTRSGRVFHKDGQSQIVQVGLCVFCYVTHARTGLCLHVGAEHQRKAHTDYVACCCVAVDVQVEPLAPQPEPGALLEEYQALLAAEKDCVQVCFD